MCLCIFQDSSRLTELYTKRLDDVFYNLVSRSKKKKKQHAPHQHLIAEMIFLLHFQPQKQFRLDYAQQLALQSALSETYC